MPRMDSKQHANDSDGLLLTNSSIYVCARCAYNNISDMNSPYPANAFILIDI